MYVINNMLELVPLSECTRPGARGGGAAARTRCPRDAVFGIECLVAAWGSTSAGSCDEYYCKSYGKTAYTMSRVRCV